MSFTFIRGKICCWKEAVLYNHYLPQSYTRETVQNGRQGNLGSQKRGFHIANIETTAMGWATRKKEYSQTSDDTLHIVVRSVLSVVVLGALRERGLLVQRNRSRQSIFRISPVSRALTCFRTVHRRVYNRTKPNSLTFIHMYL